MELRPYQLEAEEALREGLRRGFNHQVLCSPTGSGKTMVAVDMMKRVVENGKRACFLVDRLVLVDQTSAALTKAGLYHGVLQAGNSHRVTAPIVVCSSQTLERMSEQNLKCFFEQFDLVIIDECHIIRRKVLKVLGGME